MSAGSLPPYLEHLPDCKVVLCHEHGRCSTMNDLARHLQKEHNVTRQDSNRICETARALDIAQTRSQIQAPAHNSPHIKGLIIVEGFRCTVEGCDEFVTISEGYFRKHLQDHGLPRSQKLERANEVQLQNMYTVKAPLYFIVHPKVPLGAPGEDVRPRTEEGLVITANTFTSRGRPVEKKTELTEQQEQEADNDQEQEEVADSEKENVVAPTPMRTKSQRLVQPPRTAPNPSLSRKARSGRSPPSRPAPTQPLGYSTRRSPSPPSTRRLQNRPFDHNARPSPSPPPSRPAKRRATETAFSDPLPAYEPSFVTSFAKMMFRTERKDTGKVFLCVASDLMTADSRRLDPSAMNVDFNRYRRLLDEEGVMGDGFKLEFIDDTGKRVQVTNQVSFRAAVICQVAQKVDSIIFSSEPIPRPSLPAVKPVPLELTPPALHHPGPLFAETVFCTERLNTDQTHVCLASNLRAHESDPLNMRPTDVDFETYSKLLREAEVLDDSLVLGFIDSRDKRIQVKNQAMFIAGVVYQVSKKVDMIRFSSVPITRLPLPSPHQPVSLGQPLPSPGEVSGSNDLSTTQSKDLLTTPSSSKAGERLIGSTDSPSVRPPMSAPARPQPAPVDSRRENVDERSCKSGITSPHDDKERPLSSGSKLLQSASPIRRRKTPAKLKVTEHPPVSPLEPSSLPPTEKQISIASPLKQTPIPTKEKEHPAVSPLEPSSLTPKEKQHATATPLRQSPLLPKAKEHSTSSPLKQAPHTPFNQERADRNARSRRLSSSSSSDEKIDERMYAKKREARQLGSQMGRVSEPAPGSEEPPTKNGVEGNLGQTNQVDLGVARPVARNIREFQLGRVSQQALGGERPTATNGRRRRII